MSIRPFLMATASAAAFKLWLYRYVHKTTKNCNNQDCCKMMTAGLNHILYKERKKLLNNWNQPSRWSLCWRWWWLLLSVKCSDGQRRRLWSVPFPLSSPITPLNCLITTARRLSGFQNASLLWHISLACFSYSGSFGKYWKI